MSAAKHTPEALRLAAWLEANVFGKGITEKNDLACAAELRRLHAENAELLEALRSAEAVLSDIGDATREPGDDVAWCERRAAQAIPKVRAAIAKAGGAA